MEVDELAINKKRCLINPFGNFKAFWGNVNLILIGYVAIITPFKFAFTASEQYPMWDYGEFLIDFFFLVDIVLSFFTPIYIRQQLVETHG